MKIQNKSSFFFKNILHPNHFAIKLKDSEMFYVLEAVKGSELVCSFKEVDTKCPEFRVLFFERSVADKIKTLFGQRNLNVELVKGWQIVTDDGSLN